MKLFFTTSLLIILATETSLAGGDEILLSPNSPSTSSEIKVVLTQNLAGCQVLFPEITNFEVAGNEVLLTVVVDTLSDVSPCPPAEPMGYVIGQLPAGNYSLTVQGFPINPVSTDTPFYLAGPVSFEVRAGNVREAVPTLNLYSIAVLVILFLLIFRLTYIKKDKTS